MLREQRKLGEVGRLRERIEVRIADLSAVATRHGAGDAGRPHHRGPDDKNHPADGCRSARRWHHRSRRRPAAGDQRGGNVIDEQNGEAYKLSRCASSSCAGPSPADHTDTALQHLWEDTAKKCRSISTAVRRGAMGQPAAGGAAGADFGGGRRPRYTGSTTAPYFAGAQGQRNTGFEAAPNLGALNLPRLQDVPATHAILEGVRMLPPATAMFSRARAQASR